VDSETRIARLALDAQTQPRLADVPPGLYTKQVPFHELDGSYSLRTQDRAEIWVSMGGEPGNPPHAVVPVRNVGNGPARITEVRFYAKGRGADGAALNPVLPAGELTTVSVGGEAGDEGWVA